MAPEASLVDRVRAAFTRVRGVEEKKMFGGTTFMVRGKMCVSARAERIMCRIDPAIHEQTIAHPGCRTMVMKGREYPGYVLVDAGVLVTPVDLDRWIRLALDYNGKSQTAGKAAKQTAAKRPVAKRSSASAKKKPRRR